MMNNEVTVSQNSDDRSEAIISLPIKSKDLGDFISSLLGQEQTIERSLFIKFDIDHQWLINLHHLIYQRIMQQSQARLVYFNAVIYFENGLKRTLESIEALESYVETQQLTSIGVKLIWNYLVQFPNKNFPEKQQITFEAFSQRLTLLSKQSRSSKPTLGIRTANTMTNLVPVDIRSTVHYQIDHTERTWGDDIESIIHSQVEGIERVTPVHFWFIQIIRLFMLLLIMYGGIFIYNKFIDTRDGVIKTIISRYTTDTNQIDVELLNNKLNLLIEVASVPLYKSEFNSFLVVMGTSMIALLFAAVTIKVQYSFLTLTNKDKVYKEKMIKRESQSTLIILASFIVSVVASIIANLIYVRWFI